MKQVIDAFKGTFREKPLWVVTLFIAIISGALLQLLPPQILRSIIDNYIAPGRVQGLWILAFAYLLAVALGGLFDFFRELTIAMVGEDMLAKIRFTMGKKLSRLPISYYSNSSVGSIISYFTSDVDAVGSLITTGVIGIIADGIKVIGIILSIYFLSPRLTIFVLILVPIIYALTRFFKGATLKAQIATRKALGKINAAIQEIFNGIQTIKLFNKEGYFVKLFQEPLNENIKAVNRTSTYDSIFPCIMQVLRAIFITLIVIIAAPRGLGNLSISIGAIAASVELISKMLAPIESIAMEFQTIQEAVSGLRRINEFSSLKEEEREFYKDMETSFHNKSMDIIIDNLSFSYDGKKEIVKDVSFKVYNGSKAAIVGRTGAGKSTLISLISGLYRPQKGSITIGGIDPFLIPPRERRKLLGIVPQNFTIYDGTIKEAITLFDDSIKDEAVVLAAKTVGLHEEIMNLEKGYDTLIGEGEQQLSNGQYQLLSLACAIVCNPPILLLDEVTSGLDAITEEKIFKALREISKNRTLLTISHRVSGIIDADEVFILKDGEVVESGSPKELVVKEGWYKSLNQMEVLGWKI